MRPGGSRKISEDVFFARIVAVRRAFSMQTDSRVPKQIAVRLLNDDEQRAAQAGMK